MRTAGLSGDQLAGDVTFRPPTINRETGAPFLHRDRDGSGWIAASLVVHGQRGAYLTELVGHAGTFRMIADHAARMAAYLDARSARKPAPCLCTAWSHNLFPCSGIAQPGSHMCDGCYPAAGQSTLAIGHGETDRPEPPRTCPSGTPLDVTVRGHHCNEPHA